jgi:hypothetical protein
MIEFFNIRNQECCKLLYFFQGVKMIVVVILGVKIVSTTHYIYEGTLSAQKNQDGVVVEQ